MSLISINNFIAPFTNKTHMGTIVLGAVLFAFFRLQGGTIAIHNDERVSPRAPASTNDLRSPLPDSVGVRGFDTEGIPARPARNNSATDQNLPEEGTISITNDEEDLLQDIIGAPSQNNKAQQPAQNPQRAVRPTGRPSTSGLDDIERSLGIR